MLFDQLKRRAFITLLGGADPSARSMPSEINASLVVVLR
jgi:hypothetical protein